MKISIYQIVLALVASYIIGQRLLRFIRREQTQSLFKLLTVIVVWGGIGAVALFPEIAHFTREKFGFGENFNTMIFITFVILFVLFFRILSIIERIETNITELIRKEALTESSSSLSSKKFIKKKKE